MTIKNPHAVALGRIGGQQVLFPLNKPHLAQPETYRQLAEVARERGYVRTAGLLERSAQDADQLKGDSLACCYCTR